MAQEASALLQNVVDRVAATTIDTVYDGTTAMRHVDAAYSDEDIEKALPNLMTVVMSEQACDTDS